MVSPGADQRQIEAARQRVFAPLSVKFPWHIAGSSFSASVGISNNETLLTKNDAMVLPVMMTRPTTSRDFDINVNDYIPYRADNYPYLLR